MDNQPKKLYRSRTDKVIAGVCGGLGGYFNMDSVIFRIIFLVLFFAGGSGLWLYVILAIIIPKEPLAGQASSAVNPKEQFHEFVADARSSARHWAGEMRGELKNLDHERAWRNRRLWFGMIIVVIGALALMNQLFPQPWASWSVLWPVLIIIAGIAILSRGGHHRQ